MEGIWGFLGCGYMGLGMLLIIRLAYLGERLLRYVDREYPEEAPIIRTCERLACPWAEGYKALKILIKKERAGDPELARRAEKYRASQMHIFGWCAIFLLVFAGFVAYALLRKRWG